MKKALIVVDLQSYFLNEAPEDLPAKVANYIDNNFFDIVVFTLFQNKSESNFENSLGWSVCNEEKDLIQPVELKKYINSHNVFIKNTYSAFKNSKFRDYLESNKIEKIVICGVDTDACVIATAFDGFDLGYKISIYHDLCYSRAGLSDSMKLLADRNLEDVSESN